MRSSRPPLDRFADFYGATKDGAPRQTAMAALDAFGALPPRRFAIDLGCGAGRDTLAILERGWRVLAIDASPEAIVALLARSDLTAGLRSRLECRVARFESLDLPSADLVNSSFALPLCPPEAFPELWRRIAAALRPNGRFAGQFFGRKDSWASRSGLTMMARFDLERLFGGWSLELFDEEESDSVTPRGKRKHWHIFHVVARKPGS